MKTWTGIEIERAQPGLESAAAMTLGRMIFEFSRLDMVLGLFLVSSNGGSRLESLTKTVANCSFHFQ